MGASSSAFEPATVKLSVSSSSLPWCSSSLPSRQTIGVYWLLLLHQTSCDLALFTGFVDEHMLHQWHFSRFRVDEHMLSHGLSMSTC